MEARSVASRPPLLPLAFLRRLASERLLKVAKPSHLLDVSSFHRRYDVLADVGRLIALVLELANYAVMLRFEIFPFGLQDLERGLHDCDCTTVSNL